MTGLWGIIGLGALLALAGMPAMAQTAEPAPTGLWERPNLLGSMGGLRPALDDSGITVSLGQTTDILGNLTGGRNRGAAIEGQTLLTIGADLEKSLGLAGGSFNVSGMYRLGRGLARSNLLSINTPSSVEADPAPRLFELWYQQKFLDGLADLRIGQQAVDTEFLTTTYGGVFVSGAFGWPGLPTADLPASGNSAPLATPGLRLHLQPSDALSLLLGVYNGNPAGPGTGDPQLRDLNGTALRTSDGVFVIAELQYAVNQGDKAEGLPATYKLGFWYNSNRFADQQYDTRGLSLASPLSTGLPRQHRGDDSVYAVLDQLVWRPEGVKDGGIGVFARVMAAPDDRNLVSFYADGGITLKGMIADRDSDTLGLGLSYTRISAAARAFNQSGLQFGTAASPVRSAETVLELTYQAQITPWFQLQPDVQYIFSPGGGAVNPSLPTKRLGDALVVGIRTLVTF